MSVSEGQLAERQAWLELMTDTSLGDLWLVHFAEVGLGYTLDSWQKDVLLEVGKGTDRIAIKSGHGPGKTFTLAMICWGYLVCRAPINIIVTGASEDQLKSGVRKCLDEIAENLPDFVRSDFDFQVMGIRNKRKPLQSFVDLRTARPEKPQVLAGLHNEAGWTILIADEASDVHDAVFRASGGSMSGKRTQTILAGNPIHPHGYFHKCFHEASELWKLFTVGYGPHAPRITAKYADSVAKQYGADSNEYRFRVLGEFPTSEGSTIIPFAWAKAAQDRDLILSEDLPVVWGVDVAGGGEYSSGRNVIVRRNKLAVLPEITMWNGERGSTISGRIKHEHDITAMHNKPRVILVDAIGVGSEVTERLRELGLPVRGVSVSESPCIDKNRFANLKAELWWAVRDWLENNMRSLPACGDDGLPCLGGMGCIHDQLVRELSSLKYSTESGKTKLEGKSALKKRTDISPDLADAMVLTFAEDISILAGDDTGGWGQPIVSQIGGLP